MNLKAITQNYDQPLEMQVARLEMMLEISRSLNSTLDLETLLGSIMEVALELTNSEEAGILLVDKKTGKLHFEAATGERWRQLERIPVPLESSIAGWIVQNGEALVIDNAKKDARHFGGVDKQTNFTTRNILGVPLMVKTKIIGVLEVLNKQQDTGFISDDIDIMNTLAAQAAVAIENARLFRQSDELANVVHELRSPMASIVGYSQLMLLQPDMPTKNMRQALNSIYQEANRLAQMVNDFLELARMESGRIRMASERVDLHQLTQEVVDQLYPQAKAKSVTLTLDAPPSVPVVEGDNNRLRQVILNLVDNAIKYNWPSGRVDIKLSHNRARLHVSVFNTGQGIAPDDLELVFDKFYRTQTDEEEDVQGTGLGLPIAKKIIETHDGDIWVESELGKGCTFTFSLPLNKPDN